MNTTIKKYADFLYNISGKILLGCDGFVHETYEIVEVRKSQTEFTPMKRLSQFGELLVERADGGRPALLRRHDAGIFRAEASGLGRGLAGGQLGIGLGTMVRPDSEDAGWSLCGRASEHFFC
jgi:hypothetical protein